MKKIKHKKIVTTILVMICIIFNYAFFIPNTDNAIASGKSNFGGEIKMTIDCSGPMSCLPTSVDFAICLIPKCLLGQNFIIQIFDNYANQTEDAFDVMLDTVLEPLEADNCNPGMCNQLGITLGLPCKIFCTANLAAQSANASYVGLKTEVIKNSIQAVNPAIVWVTQPQTIMPVCNANNPYPIKKYILGQGIGMGFYTSMMGDEIGDNCAGRYFPAIGF